LSEVQIPQNCEVLKPMSILTPDEEAEYWAYEFQRTLAEMLKESTFLASDQHERRAAYLIQELELRGYRIVREKQK
jgi:hypothetical protein